MATTLNVKDGGTWRTATGVYIKDGGVWRDCQNVYVKDGGTWRLVFSKAVVYNPITNLQGTTYTSTDNAPGLTEATLDLNTDGTWEVTYAGGPSSGTWGSNVVGSNYWVKFTRTSETTSGVGGGSSTATTGWLNLGSQQTVTCLRSTSGVNPSSRTAVYTIEIATDASGTNIVSTTTGLTLVASLV